MAEGLTCYERGETFCEDQICLRTGCRIRNERLATAVTLGREEISAIIADWFPGKQSLRDGCADDILARLVAKPADEPARPELLALKSRLDNADLRHNGGKTAYAILPEDRRSLGILVEAALGKPADEGVREALIPAGIYFDIDGSNFYSVERGCGCGQIFYIAPSPSTTGEPKR